MRRRGTVYAGAELVLMGLGLPLAYVTLTVLRFNDFTTERSVLVVAASVLLVGLGVTAIWRGTRRRPGE